MSKEPVWGKASAPVKMIVFMDFECPYCALFSKTFESVKRGYDNSKVQIVWMNNPLPFHKNARQAAIAAETVRAIGGNDAFWKFQSMVFANQKSLTMGGFEKWAKASGVNLNEFSKAMDQGTYTSKVDNDLIKSKKLGIKTTPYTLVNSETVTGAEGFSKLKSIIDPILETVPIVEAAGAESLNVMAKSNTITQRVASSKTAAASSKTAAAPATQRPEAAGSIADITNEKLAELGWHKTAKELFEAISGPFDEEVCGWIAGFGNSKKLQDLESETYPMDYAKMMDVELARLKTEKPEDFAKLDGKIQQYYDCFLKAYGAEETSDSSWMWILGLLGVGLGGWWLVKGKK